MEESLKQRASSINDSMGRRAVIMTGPRTDINEIVASCDLFVGVSRTALEAMSCEKPVILAGNAGYMGLFCHEKLEEAKSDNFCCRTAASPKRRGSGLRSAPQTMKPGANWL